jgi:hypothetical protein
MSLEQALRQKWSQTAALAALVPPQRVFSGLAAGADDLPYVVIERTVEKPWLPAGIGPRRSRLQFALRLWTDDLEDGNVLAREVLTALNAAELAWPGGAALDLRWERTTQSLTNDGLWQLDCHFVALIEET